MKKKQLILGIILGFVSTLLLVGSQESCPSPPSIDDNRTADMSRDLDAMKKASGRFTDHIFSIEDRDDYLSHFDACMAMELVKDRDACIMGFIFDVKDYSACFLLSDVSLVRSCMNLESD